MALKEIANKDTFCNDCKTRRLDWVTSMIEGSPIYIQFKKSALHKKSVTKQILRYIKILIKQHKYDTKSELKLESHRTNLKNVSYIALKRTEGIIAT